jgi:hypothetical protein
MAQGSPKNGHGHGGHVHNDEPRVLPADLSAPADVLKWRTRAFIWAAIFGLGSLVFLFTGHLDHFLRAWVVGFMLIFGLTVGGMALLMVQYVTGGKWGVVLRRPLEAMSRCLPLLALFWLPIGFGAKHLYQWAWVKDAAAALANGTITEAQAHAIEWKRPMLNIHGFWIRAAIYFLIWGFYAWKLNSWSMQREADPNANTEARTTFWRTKFENLSGLGIIVYAFTLTGGAIDWVMSMDVTWYSSIWGLLYLVGQGFSVLAFSIMMVLILSKWQPYETVLRVTEQTDLGKLTFAFVMLNIYLAFSQFLIIWSGNSPEEIPWYLARFGGGWAVIITLDFIFHWVIPFTLLLSRPFKRNKRKMILLCKWIIFARAWDLWWQVEPGFADSRRNLHWSVGMCAYLVVPIFMGACWLAYYFTQLNSRPVFIRHDPHVEELLEPEHVHA